MTSGRLPGTLAALLLSIAIAGCSSAERAPAGDALARADAAFRTGDYTAAAPAYESYLAAGPRRQEDQAVYLRLAVIYLVLGAPEVEPDRGKATLERMIRTYPRGRLREVAETILSLRERVEVARREAASGRARRASLEARIRELERQIEALKAIDLESRRPPD